jgi:flavin-binding protein dodecin
MRWCSGWSGCAGCRARRVLSQPDTLGRLPGSATPRSHAMNKITKVIELSASSTKGFEKASKTVKNIKGAWINDLKVITNDDGSVAEWRVNMRVNFLVD